MLLVLPDGLEAIKQEYDAYRFDAAGHVIDPEHWEQVYLGFAPLPRALPSYDASHVSHITIHKKLIESLTAIMAQVYRNHPATYNQLFFSGAYNPRMKRGVDEPSLHALGVAIDFNGDTFPMQRHRQFYRSDMPPWFGYLIDVFHAYGWKWGGDFGDPMHFQAAKGY